MKYSIIKEDKDYVMVKAITENANDQHILTMFHDGETNLQNNELQTVLHEAGNIVKEHDYKVLQVDIPNDDVFAVKIRPKYV